MKLKPTFDVDWFKFTAVSGTFYQFETVLGTLTDSVLRLIGTDGTTELDCDDDGGPGFASSIDWTAPASGNYYLEVSGYGTDTGTYTLSLSATGPGSGIRPSALSLCIGLGGNGSEPRAIGGLMLNISDFSFELADDGIAVSTSAGTSSTAANQSDSALLSLGELARVRTHRAGLRRGWLGRDGDVEHSEDLCDAIDSIFDELGTAALAAGLCEIIRRMVAVAQFRERRSTPTNAPPASRRLRSSKLAISRSSSIAAGPRCRHCSRPLRLTAISRLGV